jgi:DNA-binding Lrp family transcriptional regulator
MRCNCLEKIFSDLSTNISAFWSNEKKLKISKRHAFVFITAEPDSSKSALEDLKKVDGVLELYSSRGAYDIIAKVSGESLEYLREVVFKQIKNLSTIRSTLTLMVV